MRVVWIIAATVLVLAAIAAAWWPRAGTPSVDLAARPPEVALVCPQPPVVDLVAAPVTAAMTDPVAAVAPPAVTTTATTAPKVTVGAKAALERIDHQTVRIDGKYLVRGSGS